MKGTGKTVMVGTELEQFGVEVLGVMKDVSPGRDMILARLSGCNLEHAGIIQGMSGSPVYIDGKLVGAVAFAWEFAKDPIAGITPFEQMVAYVRANDRRIAAESRPAEPERPEKGGVRTAGVRLDPETLGDRDQPLPAIAEPGNGPTAVSGGGLAGMKPIATPMAASGFTPRSLAMLAERLGPVGLAPTAGGSAQAEIVARFGDKPLVPGAPVSVAMVTGDFDLSGIGTVTHVEGDRVYAFGHPMMGQGACEFPMMTGYIHTVYPRTSVSMKLGSPLKVVGVLDTDVSTAVSGRLGQTPDMLPMSVQVQSGRFAEPHTYHVESRPRAQPAADAGHVGPGQRDRHRGQPARRVDRPPGRDADLEGPRADHDPRDLERPPLHRPDRPDGDVWPDREYGQPPGPQPLRPAAGRDDRLRGGGRARPEPRPDRVRPPGQSTASSPARPSRRP